MLGSLASKTSTGADELKICFEVKGEQVCIYIPIAKLTAGKGREDAQKILDQVACAICCAQKKGFGACLARCLDDGKCCDNGATNCD